MKEKTFKFGAATIFLVTLPILIFHGISKALFTKELKDSQKVEVFNEVFWIFFFVVITLLVQWLL